MIASKQAAVDANTNSFKTGGSLTLSDIQNSASYKGDSGAIAIGAGSTAAGAGINGVAPGFGSDKGNASSTTKSGILGMAGNSAVRTGDANTGLKPIFDAQKVQADITAQVQITQAFTREAPKAAAT